LKNIFTILIILSLSIFARTINYGVFNNQAYIMAKGQISLKGSYLRINDDIDIFNMKDSELGSLSKYGSTIGNMSGYEAEIDYGILKRDSIFLNFQEWNIDYGGSKLTNRRLEFTNRYNLTYSKYAFVNALSFDIGFRRNWANRVEITNIDMMNSMIKKVYPNSDYSIGDDGSILKNGTKTTLYDKNGNRLSPSVDIDNLESNSIFLRFLFGKRVFDKTLINLYTTYYYVDLSSKVDISPSSLINSIDIESLNRDEQVVDVGFSWITEFKYLLFELNYEYAKIFRKDLTYKNYSHTLDIAISKPITRNLLLFASGKVMFQQFNRDIPYLYNRYTETQFDKKYGFAKFGLIYKFKGLSF